MDAELNISVAKTMEVASAQYERLRGQKPKRKKGARSKKNIQELNNMELMKNIAIHEVVSKDAWKSDQFIDMVLESPQLLYILADRTAPISFDEKDVPKPAETRGAMAMLRSEYWAWLRLWSKGLVGRGPRPAVEAAARRWAHPAIGRLEDKLDFLGSVLKYSTVLMPELRQQLLCRGSNFPAVPPMVQPMLQPAAGLQPPLGLGRKATLRMVSSYLALQVRASYRSGRGARAAFAELAARTGLREPQVAAFWCRIRAVALRHVRSLLAGGDEASPRRRPRRADWAVADTAMLYDTQENVVTEDSLTLYSQSQPLWALLELSGMLSLEPRGEAAAWRAAKQQYQGSGQGNSRQASLVLLQRRWHELKASAAQRVVAFWRARRREKDRSKLKATKNKGSEPSAPLIPPTRLYSIQLALVRRYPNVALRPPPAWPTLVREGLVYSDDDEDDAVSEPATPPRPPRPLPTPAESNEDVIIMETSVETMDLAAGPPLSGLQGLKPEDHSADNDQIPPLVFNTDGHNTMAEPANSLPVFASLDLDAVESAIIFSDDDSDDGTADVVVDGQVGADSISDSGSVSDEDSLGETMTASEFDKTSVSNQSDMPNDTNIKSEANDEATNWILDRLVYGNEEECNVKSEEVVPKGCENLEVKNDINVEEIAGANVDYEETLEAKDEVASDVEEFEDTKVVDENFEETKTEVSVTNAVEPKVGESQVDTESTTVIDPKLLQSPVVTLNKLEIIRQSQLKDYLNNPDFNVKLKKLNQSFLKSKRNRRRYRKCVPLTVDLVRMDEREVEKMKREVKELQELEEFVRKEREMLDMRCLSFYDEDDGCGDMPTFEELQELLETIEKEQLTATPPEAGGWGPTVKYCCLARRDRALNDARRRRWHAGSAKAGLPIHKHARGTKCHCCCVHLLSAGEGERELRRARRELARDLAKALKEARGNVEQPMLEVFTSGEEDENSDNDKSENNHQQALPTRSKRKHKMKKKKNKDTTSQIREVTEDPYAQWERQKSRNKQKFTLPSRKRSAMEPEDVDRFKNQKKQRLLEEKCVNIAEVVKKGVPKMEGPGRKIAQETEKKTQFRIVKIDRIADKAILPAVKPPVRLIRVQTPAVSKQDMCHQGVLNQGMSSQTYQQPLLNINLQVNTIQQNPKQGPTYVQPLISVSVHHQQAEEFYQDGQVLTQAGQIYQQNQVLQTPSQILNNQQPIFQNQQSQFRQPGPILNKQTAPTFQKNPIFQHTGQILDQQTGQIYQQTQMYQPPVRILNQSMDQIFQLNQFPKSTGHILNQQSTGLILNQPCSSGQFYQLPGQQYHQTRGYHPGRKYQVGIVPQMPVTCHQVNLSNQTIDVTQMLNRAEIPASTDRRVSKRAKSKPPTHLRNKSVMKMAYMESSKRTQPIVYMAPKQKTEAKASKDLLLKAKQGPGSGRGPCSDGPVTCKVGTVSLARDLAPVRARGGCRLRRLPAPETHTQIRGPGTRTDRQIRREGKRGWMGNQHH